MEQQYLIDTNSVIDYLGQKLPVKGMNFMHKVVDRTPNISVITKIELLGFNADNEHLHLLTQFVDDSIVLDLSPSVADKCIEIRRKYKTKLPDAIIAATAIVYDLELITRNISDFKNIEKLKYTNPYLLS